MLNIKSEYDKSTDEENPQIEFNCRIKNNVPLTVVGDPTRLKQVVILLLNIVLKNIPNLMSIKTELGFKKEKRNKSVKHQTEKVQQFNNNILAIEISYLELEDYA
jgi:hypothetical protein